jgi:hypothetical protein
MEKDVLASGVTSPVKTGVTGVGGAGEEKALGTRLGYEQVKEESWLTGLGVMPLMRNSQLTRRWDEPRGEWRQVPLAVPVGRKGPDAGIICCTKVQLHLEGYYVPQPTTTPCINLSLATL